MAATDYNSQPSQTLSHSHLPNYWLHTPGLYYNHSHTHSICTLHAYPGCEVYALCCLSSCSLPSLFIVMIVILVLTLVWVSWVLIIALPGLYCLMIARPLLSFWLWVYYNLNLSDFCWNKEGFTTISSTSASALTLYFINSMDAVDRMSWQNA